MALQTEIWGNAIVKNLFADGSFAAQSLNHSAYVNNKVVHIPNAGNPPEVVMDRSIYPISIAQRTDSDLSYQLHEFSTGAFRISNAEQVELTYDKRESVISASRSIVTEKVHDYILTSWVPSSFEKVATTGTNITAHLPSATSNRKKITLADILAVKKAFDKENIPMENRFGLLDYEMMAQLLDVLTGNNYNAFLASADAQKGIVGEIFGFKMYQRAKVLRTVADGTSLVTDSTNFAATDSAAGLFWQKDCVSHALGSTEIFENEKDPSYQADIVSCLVRAGGSYCRYDKKGVVVLYQGTPV